LDLVAGWAFRVDLALLLGFLPADPRAGGRDRVDPVDREERAERAEGRGEPLTERARDVRGEADVRDAMARRLSGCLRIPVSLQAV
jgi:hypothetical protein